MTTIKISDLHPVDDENLFTELTVSEQEKLSGGVGSDFAGSCLLPFNAATHRCAWEGLSKFWSGSYLIAGTKIQRYGRPGD